MGSPEPLRVADGVRPRALADGGLGIGAWYNLTVAIFGGTAPLVIQWLGDAGHSSWFFWYVAAGAVIAFLATLSLPETKGSVLK